LQREKKLPNLLICMKKISRERQITQSVIALKLLPENYIIFLQFVSCCGIQAISTLLVIN